MGYANLKTVLERIKMTVGFLNGQGKDTSTVFELEESYRDTPQMTIAMNQMRKDPDMKRLISEGYTSPDFDLDQLEQCPRGSLGYTYAKMMKALNFDPHFYKGHDLPLSSDENYCIMRVRKTHDIHHCITGFGPANGGELSVIGVTAYQFGYPAFGLIDLTAVARAFQLAEVSTKDGRPMFMQDIDLVGQGMLLGRTCKPLLGIKWEEAWDKPLDRWREELNVKPVTTTPNSWYVQVPNWEGSMTG
ncbi:MAG TPA: Coq4 family protein [Archangium sp.]|nr:Coq4 family protein [Archangium sp.]